MNWRPKQKESTLCTWTECGNEIREGDILGYGDNYECIVYYNPFEGGFEVVEFGYTYKNKRSFRVHDLLYQTVKWKILGNISTLSNIKIKGWRTNFNYVNSIKRYYKK